jgi:hypothetical protein
MSETKELPAAPRAQRHREESALAGVDAGDAAISLRCNHPAGGDA